jgi:predicted RNA-binding protein
MNYWLVVTSAANFRLDRETLNFKTQGLPYRCRKTVQKMTKGDKVVYYIAGLQRFGATATITGEYYEDKTKLWIADDDESWPSRCPSEPDLVLLDDELIDAKKLVPNLSFIERKDVWGSYIQGSIKPIPEEDFRLIESEMRKVIADRQVLPGPIEKPKSHAKTEKEYEEEVLQLPLQSKSLHDRIGEMLEQVGSWLDYNTQTRYRITPDHAYELDVVWLRGKNPEIAIEIQISGNLTEAKDRLAHARKFNYRKVILVIKEQEMDRLNTLMRHEHDLRCWMEAWSIGAIFEMYTAGQKFNSYYKRLTESVYKDKSSLQMIE